MYQCVPFTKDNRSRIFSFQQNVLNFMMKVIVKTILPIHFDLHAVSCNKQSSNNNCLLFLACAVTALIANFVVVLDLSRNPLLQHPWFMYYFLNEEILSCIKQRLFIIFTGYLFADTSRSSSTKQDAARNCRTKLYSINNNYATCCPLSQGDHYLRFSGFFSSA